MLKKSYNKYDGLPTKVRTFDSLSIFKLLS